MRDNRQSATGAAFGPEMLVVLAIIFAIIFSSGEIANFVNGLAQ